MGKLTNHCNFLIAQFLTITKRFILKTIRKKKLAFRNISIRNFAKSLIFGGVVGSETIVCSFAVMTKEQLLFVYENNPNLSNLFVFNKKKQKRKK